MSNFGGMKKSHNMLREALIDRLHRADASFDFCVQVRDIPDASEKDRIENDAVASWDERDFPPTKVAEIRVLRLEDDFDADVMMAIGQHLSFTPWHNVPIIKILSGVSTRRAGRCTSVSRLYATSSTASCAASRWHTKAPRHTSLRSTLRPEPPRRSRVSYSPILHMATHATPTPQTGSSDAPPGSLPDRYRIVGELGRGGMGVVYHAVDSAEHRDVAIKMMLSPSLAVDVVALLRFQREARTASSLSHLKTCTVYEIGHTPALRAS